MQIETNHRHRPRQQNGSATPDYRRRKTVTGNDKMTSETKRLSQDRLPNPNKKDDGPAVLTIDPGTALTSCNVLHKTFLEIERDIMERTGPVVIILDSTSHTR